MADKFGQKLRKLRKKNLLSQSELRERLNAQGYEIRSNGTISKWENGASRPREAVVEVLAGIFNLGEDALLREAGYLREDTAPIPTDADSIAVRSLQDHTDRMVDIAATLLGEKPRRISPEIIWTPDGTFPPSPLEESMSKRNLTQALRGTRDYLLLSGEYTTFDFDCLESHLREEGPRVKTLGLEGAVRDNPRELVHALRLIARRKKLKGKCPVCPDS